jgi:hypothetical protein
MDCEAASDGSTYFVACQDDATWSAAHDSCLVSLLDTMDWLQLRIVQKIHLSLV